MLVISHSVTASWWFLQAENNFIITLQPAWTALWSLDWLYILNYAQHISLPRHGVKHVIEVILPFPGKWRSLINQWLLITAAVQVLLMSAFAAFVIAHNFLHSDLFCNGIFLWDILLRWCSNASNSLMYVCDWKNGWAIVFTSHELFQDQSVYRYFGISHRHAYSMSWRPNNYCVDLLSQISALLDADNTFAINYFFAMKNRSRCHPIILMTTGHQLLPLRCYHTLPCVSVRIYHCCCCRSFNNDINVT